MCEGQAVNLNAVIPEFRGVNNLEEIKNRFYTAAQSIMFEHNLVFDQFERRCMRITAVELYLHCRVWEDRNTDQDSEQLNRGTWYVHRRGRNASRSRIDITAGCKCEAIYCGLLIRGIDWIDRLGIALRRIVRGEAQVLGHQGVWTEDEIGLLEQIHCCGIVSGPLRLVRRQERFPGWQKYEPRINLRYPTEPWNADLRVFAVQG